MTVVPVKRPSCERRIQNRPVAKIGAPYGAGRLEVNNGFCYILTLSIFFHLLKYQRNRIFSKAGTKKKL